MKWKEKKKKSTQKERWNCCPLVRIFFRWNSSFSLIYRTHTPSSKILWEQRPVNCIISSHLFQADFPFFIPQSIYSAPVLLVGAVRLDLDFIINIIYLLWLLQWKWEKNKPRSRNCNSQFGRNLLIYLLTHYRNAKMREWEKKPTKFKLTERFNI